MMPANSQRRGAVRKGASRKGPTVGSGGQQRKGLQGKGPTPKAVDREQHVAAKKRRAAERGDEALAKGRAGASLPPPGAPPRRPSRPRAGGARAGRAGRASSEM